MKTIETLGEEFCKRHDWLLTVAWINNVAICGGCAAAIATGRSDYKPSDLDLVSTKSNALDFIRKITDFLLERNVHFRIYANSRNEYVPSPAAAHFRIQCPFWLPICLFVLPEAEFNRYRITGNHLLQLPRDISRAANLLTEKDGKPRMASHILLEEESPEEDSGDFIQEDYLESPEDWEACNSRQILDEILPDTDQSNSIGRYPKIK